MIDWDLYGKNPAGHHITNLCLHAANAVLLFLLLLYMTGYLGRSAIVAFLFALHPAHVESVAWIAERKDVLCTFFWFAALLAYAWYVRKPSWKRFAWVVCAFACALMSKPMAVTLPFTLLLLDYWPLRRITFRPKSRAQWLSSFGSYALKNGRSSSWQPSPCVITFIAQRVRRRGDCASSPCPCGKESAMRLVSYCRYIRITFWPDPLIVYYYYDSNHIMFSPPCYRPSHLSWLLPLCWHFREKSLIAFSAGCGFWEHWCPSSASCRSENRPWPSVTLMFLSSASLSPLSG